MAVAAFTTVYIVPITCNLHARALQRGDHAQQPYQHVDPCIIGHALVEDFLGLPAIVGSRQSSTSSPYKARVVLK